MNRRLSHCLILSCIGLTAPLMSFAADAPPVEAQRLEFEQVDFSDTRKINVTLTPDKIRVDQPQDKFSFIYDVSTKTYTGLEQRDAHYWSFNWPKVQAYVQNSKRYKRRLSDLNIEGYASYDILRPDAPEPLPESPQFVWKADNQTRKISGYDCQHWIGTSKAGKTIEAWCVEQRVGGLKESLDRLKEINEPMGMVAVRPVLPPEFFVVVDSLYKAEVSPVEIAWGPKEDRTRLTLVNIQRKTVPASLFEVPNTYLPTKLQALEGIVEDDKDKK
jgi:hypothetical protein